jgi:hypothetical protein
MTEDMPGFDAAALIAELRRGDEDAMARAYRYTFGGELGRRVLAHFLHQCGVGRVMKLGESARHDAYAAGQHDAGLALAQMAGFDQASIAVAVLSDNLEGNTDDRQFNFAADGSQYFDADGHADF